MTYDDFLKFLVKENINKVTRNTFFSGYDIPKYDCDNLINVMNLLVIK